MTYRDVRNQTVFWLSLFGFGALFRAVLEFSWLLSCLLAIPCAYLTLFLAAWVADRWGA